MTEFPPLNHTDGAPKQCAESSAIASRRNFLRLAGSMAVGVGVFFVSNSLTNTELRKKVVDLIGSLVGAEAVPKSRISLITVKVYYSMMSQYIGLGEEDFVLQSPSTLQNLIDTCIVRHPSIAQMMGTMLILLDGVPAKPTASLRDGDKIQFIPVSAGG